MKVCPVCQGLIDYDELEKSIVFTPGEMISGIFFGNVSYYYHKACAENEEILLFP